MAILLQSGAFYTPGVKQRVTVQVSDTTQQRWGFELTARLNSDLEKAPAGEFMPADNFTQVICEDAAPKPCLSGPSFITHTAVATRSGQKTGATFQFDWIPPSTNAGPVTLFAAGNAANGDGAMTGDLIYTTSIMLTPVTAVSPVVGTNAVISVATGVAGPLTANSWASIYGTNLSTTTRSWNESDFVNGTMPFALDGVSVMLTQFGAPRLAYVGYVSPTQINFILPSDLIATGTQARVRNPAGLSAQTAMTVQANAPQMLTVDGKSIWGVHSSGGTLGKAGLLPSIPGGTSPAVPGETVTLYGTGLGATTPALVVGQIPTQANPLARLPQVTIGGADATVISGSVVPGTAGVYQLAVQVPTSAVNGDLPVVVTLGTASSTPALLTVQK